MNSNIFEGARRTIKAAKLALTAMYAVAIVVVIVDGYRYGIEYMLENIAIATGIYVGAIVTFHYATKGLGWIVRGFNGIPDGQDSK